MFLLAAHFLEAARYRACASRRACIRSRSFFPGLQRLFQALSCIKDPRLHRSLGYFEYSGDFGDRQSFNGQHHQRHSKLIRQAVHVLADVHQGLAIEDARGIRRFKRLARAVLVNGLEIGKENPAFETPRDASMVIDRHAHNDARQPDTNGTIAPETLETAETADQRFLYDILRIDRIPCRSDRYLEQKRTMLPSSRFKINLFCSNSNRLHPPVSLLNDSPEEGRVRNYLLAARLFFRSSSFFLTLSISSFSVASCRDFVHSFRASSYRLVLKYRSPR